MGAYATTDILRLLKGAALPLLAVDCRCPICQAKIRLVDQFPIGGYFINGGRCRSCGSRIPASEIFLEIFVFVCLAAAAVIMDFSRRAYIADIVIYELIKTVMILVKGVRENGFFRNLLFSLLMNAVIFLLIGFLFVLLYCVENVG